MSLNPSLSINRVFFQNDNSTDPTVEFAYNTQSSTIARLIVLKKNGTSWAMDNYALDTSKTKFELTLPNDNIYNFTIEIKEQGGGFLYYCIENFHLFISQVRPTLTGLHTFFNSISIGVTAPPDLGVTLYTVVFTLFDPSDNGCGIQTIERPNEQGNTYHICELNQNTDFFITANIEYTKEVLGATTNYITKDSIDLETAIATSNTYGTLNGTIAVNPTNSFAYSQSGSSNTNGFNINWEFNESETECSSTYVLYYTLDRYSSSTAIVPSNVESWETVLSGTGNTGQSYYDTSFNDVVPMKFIYYRIRGNIPVSDLNPAGWASAYEYVGAPFLTKPNLPTLSIVHPIGDSADDQDCMHVLVDGSTDDDQNTVEIAWSVPTPTTNSLNGGYSPLQFTYGSTAVSTQGVTSGFLIVALEDLSLNVVNTLTIEDYKVTAPNSYESIDLSGSYISAGNTYTVGDASISFIPYKALVVSGFGVGNILPVDNDATLSVVDLSCNIPTFGLVGESVHYTWKAIEVDASGVDIGGTQLFLYNSTDDNIINTQVPSGKRYKFWVECSQTHNTSGCTFSIATISENITKVAEKLANAVPLTLVQNTLGLSGLPDDTFYNTIDNYNLYTVTLNVNDSSFNEPAPIDQHTFQIQKSNANSWTDLGAGIYSSEQTVLSGDTSINFNVRSVYTDETETTYFGFTSYTSTVSYILTPDISLNPVLTLQDNTATPDITTTWNLISGHTPSYIDYVVHIQKNAETLTYLKDVTNSVSTGNTLPITYTEINTTAGITYGDYVTVYVTPYYNKSTGLYYPGLTRSTHSILYRNTNPSVSLSLSGVTTLLSQEITDSTADLYPNWNMDGNILSEVGFEINPKTYTGTYNNGFTGINKFYLTNPGFTATEGVTSFNDVKDLLNTILNTNKNTIESFINHNYLIYDLNNEFNDFKLQLVVTYAYTDGAGSIGTNTKTAIVDVFNRSKPSNITVTKTGSNLAITVKPNNSNLTDYVLLIAPVNLDGSYNTIPDSGSGSDNLLYQYSGNPALFKSNVGVGDLDENFYVSFTVDVNPIPSSCFAIVSNNFGIAYGSTSFPV